MLEKIKKHFLAWAVFFLNIILATVGFLVIKSREGAEEQITKDSSESQSVLPSSDSGEDFGVQEEIKNPENPESDVQNATDSPEVITNSPVPPASTTVPAPVSQPKTIKKPSAKTKTS